MISINYLAKILVFGPIFYLLFTSIFQIIMRLMYQKVVGQDPVVNTRQVDFIQAGSLVGTITDEPFITPRRPFLLIDDVRLVRVIVVGNDVFVITLIPLCVICASVTALPITVEHVDFFGFHKIHKLLLIGGESFPVLTILLLDELKSWYDQCCSASSKLLHDTRVCPDGFSKISAKVEIDIKHHKIFCTSKEFCHVSPHIELSIEPVDNQVDVDMILNVWI